MSFFLGKKIKDGASYLLESKDLCTHAVCMGMTGSGKTGLGIGLLEEAALEGIPALIIDPKGDLGNLYLAFPDLKPEEFAPWVDEGEAARNEMTVAEYAVKVAKEWANGLKSWGEDKKRILDYKMSVERTIYTPANTAGVPLSLLNSFAAPSLEFIKDAGAFRDRVLSTTSSLLGLIGIEADPIKSREHILISTILDKLWRNQHSLDLAELIRQIQNPPFTQIGVFPLDTFYPENERLKLAMALNNLLASPGFQAWMEGEPLDIQNLLYTKEGKPRHSILYIAHLSDSERMFFLTLLLNEVLSWMRRQSGTSNLRALLYMDEIFGFFPSTSSPPSKMPMIALLKQARAFGLGIVLSTQNPIDLDYRGLGNCGTWFIGKLQTERDRMRIIEGLKSSSLGETESLNELLSQCKKRTFLVQSIYKQEPILFETRWTLSYLRGPLTLPQIAELTTQKHVAIQKPFKLNKPLLPSNIKECTFENTPSNSTFEPLLLGKAKLHFIDSSTDLNIWVDRCVAAPLTNGDVDWDQSEEIKAPLTLDIPKGNFQDIPAALLNASNYKRYMKSLSQFLYQNATYTLFKVNVLKLTSQEGETEETFQKRANAALKEKLSKEYEEKINTLEDRLRKVQSRFAKDEEKKSQKRFDAWISVGKTILGGLLSRKKISKTNIGNIGTSLKRMGNSIDPLPGQEEMTQYEQEIRSLQAELLKLDPQAVIEKIQINPRKSDLIVEGIDIFWKPIP